MKTSRIFLAIIIAVALIAILVFVNKPYHSFNEDLEGKEETILYATYLREETRMDAEHHGYLAVGESVYLTGNSASVKDAESASNIEWLEILVEDNTYWIQAEAIGL